MTSRSGRILKRPGHFNDFCLAGEEEEHDKGRKSNETVNAERLWAIEDVVSVIGRQALVRWANWDGPRSWINLDHNSELDQYIATNHLQASSCTYNKDRLEVMKVPDLPQNDHLLAIRQMVYDGLLPAANAPDGNIGYSARVRVSLPLPEDIWMEHFAPVLGQDKASPFTNVVPVKNLTLILGKGWDRAQLQGSLEVYVSNLPIHPLCIKWKYKERAIYDHSSCPRCQHDSGEDLRPEVCLPDKKLLTGPAWITLTFTRRCRNILARKVRLVEEKQRVLKGLDNWPPGKPIPVKK